MSVSAPEAPSASTQERRADRRIFTTIPCTIRTAGASAQGMTVDVSQSGLLVRLDEHTRLRSRQSRIELAFPAGRRTHDALIVREDPGSRLVALRLLRASASTGPEPQAGPGAPVRLPAAVLREARALAMLVYEQALADPDGQPPESICAWSDRLAADLSVRSPGTAFSNRDLLHLFAQIFGEVLKEAPPIRDRPRWVA